jgi:hypothetical protein
MGKRIAGWLARAVGIGAALYLGRWAWVLMGVRTGLHLLDQQDASARRSVSALNPGETVPLSDVWADVGMAFGVLIAVMAVVLFVASVFPFQLIAKRKKPA